MTTIFFLIAGSVLAVTHSIALELYLYWRYLWFDIPMHVLGGAVVALGIYVVDDLRLPFTKSLLRPVPALSFVFAIALLWEGYEVLIGIPLDSTYIPDTILDICMGLLGGWLGFLVGKQVRDI